MKNLKFIPRWLLGAVIISVLALQASAMEPDVIERVSRATVFLKVDRVFTAERFTTSGTGFFIDSRGYVLTANHVIDARTVIPVGGRLTQASAPVRGIVAVIDSGTPREREVEATVVARDPDRDLALLRVRTAAPAILRVGDEDAVPKITEQVWAVGFPFGELLSVARWTENSLANPELSVNLGRITSLRKDEGGSIAMIQTDAAVNPGNSGGPLLDEEGALLGMVFAKIGDSSGVGFAVPCAEIRTFVRTSGYQVSFSPPVLTESTTTLRVLVDPIVADLSSRMGTVTLSGGNITERRATFQSRGNQLIAVLEIEPAAVAAAARDLLKATLTFTGGGQPEVKRLFRVRASTDQRAAYAAEDAGTVEIEKPDSRPLTTLSGGLKGQEVYAPKKESSIIISDQTMQQIDEWRFSEHWYENLPTETDRQLALQYDRELWALYRLLVKEKSAFSLARSKRDIQNRPDCAEMKAGENKLKGQVAALQQKLNEYSLCRCNNTWWKCDDAPCPADKPWEEDKIVGFFDTLRCSSESY